MRTGPALSKRNPELRDAKGPAAQDRYVAGQLWGSHQPLDEERRSARPGYRGKHRIGFSGAGEWALWECERTRRGLGLI